jgi:hypothetical protein
MGERSSWAAAIEMLQSRLSASNGCPPGRGAGWAEETLLRAIELSEVRVRVRGADIGGTRENRREVTALRATPLSRGALEESGVVGEEDLEVIGLRAWLNQYLPPHRRGRRSEPRDIVQQVAVEIWGNLPTVEEASLDDGIAAIMKKLPDDWAKKLDGRDRRWWWRALRRASRAI